MPTPLFSIIIPYYQPAISDKQLKECMHSIKQQRLADEIEVLLYHDGPLDQACSYPIMPTKKRFNNWGHSLRDMGIKKARGEYIIHLNADNILYTKVLKKLKRKIEETGQLPIYILLLVMRGVAYLPHEGRHEAIRTYNFKDLIVLRGNPHPGGIDAMQMIMRRDLWLKYGGWYDKSECSDSIMYPRFCQENEYLQLPILMGEHR